MQEQSKKIKVARSAPHAKLVDRLLGEIAVDASRWFVRTYVCVLHMCMMCHSLLIIL